MAVDNVPFFQLPDGTPADAATNTGSPPVETRPSTYNGSTWDLVRGNQSLQVLASATKFATESSADFTNYNHRGLHVIIDITAETVGGSTHTITPKIEGKDTESGKYYTILEGVALTAVGTTVLKIYPGISASANVSASDLLPRTWRVTVTHIQDTGSDMTYSIGAELVV